MIILPIGTESSIAFKPKVTISLIIINVIIAVISFAGGGVDEDSLLEAQRGRYIEQTKLYVLRMEQQYQASDIRESLYRIETADNLVEMHTAIIEIIGRVGGSINDYQNFEYELTEAEEGHFSEVSRVEIFREWKENRAKEIKALIGTINYSFGLIPSRMNRIHTFITHMFLHGGLFHLLGNMIFLWVVGCLLEDSWGRLPFTVFYLIGGVFAGIAFCLQDRSSAIPLIGASGAIAAAMGAFTVVHFRTRIKMFFFFLFFFRPYFGTFFLPAFIFLPLWFLQQVGLKYLSDIGGGSNVAYIAHIAGYLFGVITALVFKVTGFEENVLTRNVQERQIDAGITKDPRFEEGCRMLEKGMNLRAEQIFSKLLADRGRSTELMMDIALVYRGRGMEEKFEELGARGLKNLLISGRNDEAVTWALELISGGSASDKLSKLLMRVAGYATKNEMHQAAFDIYDFIIKNGSSPAVSAKAAISQAKLIASKMGNAEHALLVLDEAKEMNIGPEWKEIISEVESSIKRNSGMVPEIDIPTL